MKPPNFHTFYLEKGRESERMEVRTAERNLQNIRYIDFPEMRLQ
jgi:hypothetical protein